MLQPVVYPRWFLNLRLALEVVYSAIAAVCVAGIFLIGFGGMIAYRDFGSYTLGGNPWESSSFPWYVIWPMRLMSIVGAQFIVALCFLGLFRAFATLWPSSSGNSVFKSISISIVVVAIELAAAAWFGRWFG